MMTEFLFFSELSLLATRWRRATVWFTQSCSQQTFINYNYSWLL